MKKELFDYKVWSAGLLISQFSIFGMIIFFRVGNTEEEEKVEFKVF